MGGETLAIEGVVAGDEIVDIHLFGDAEQGRARWMGIGGNAQAVESIQALWTRDHIKLCGGESLAQDFGKGFPDPINPRRLRKVFKREDDHQPASAARKLSLCQRA